MRSADFFIDTELDGPQLDVALLNALRTDPLDYTGDISAAEGLLDLVEEELIDYGTGGGQKLDDAGIAIVIRTLSAVTERLGIPAELPFRDFTRFRSYWLRNGASGSWQARRFIVEDLLEPVRNQLARLEAQLSEPQIREDLIANLRNPAAIREQLDRLRRAAHNDPALAIGTAKELVESTAKTVLLELRLPVNDRDDLPALVSQAQRALGLYPSSDGSGPDRTDAVRRILSGLISITSGLGELRNRGYGTGHGPSGERVGLRPRHAHLAVNAAVTWCSFMLDTLADPASPWQKAEPS